MKTVVPGRNFRKSNFRMRISFNGNLTVKYIDNTNSNFRVIFLKEIPIPSSNAALMQKIDFFLSKIFLSFAKFRGSTKFLAWIYGTFKKFFSQIILHCSSKKTLLRFFYVIQIVKCNIITVPSLICKSSLSVPKKLKNLLSCWSDMTNLRILYIFQTSYLLKLSIKIVSNFRHKNVL